MIGHQRLVHRGAAASKFWRIEDYSAKLLALYPDPNSFQPGGNYVASLAIGLHDSQFHIRTDHHFSDHDVVTVRPDGEPRAVYVALASIVEVSFV